MLHGSLSEAYSLPPFSQWSSSQRSHNGLIEAIHYSGAAVWDQRNFTSLARLKAHSCSCRNIKAVSERSLAIKLESRVRLGEVVMAADLDWPVACVGNGKGDGIAILIKDDLARCWKNFARYHFSSLLFSELGCEHSPVWCHQEMSLPRESRGPFPIRPP